MANNDNFFTKNKDLLNAAGHSINALQNYKIQENQRELAKGTLINASLQKENKELQEKQLSLLEKKSAAEEEAKLAEEQNQFLKKLMYEALPDIEDYIEQIESNELSDNEKTESYFQAKILLRFIKVNRGLIEDIEYHRGLKKVDKSLSSLGKEGFVDIQTLEDLTLFSLKEVLPLLGAIQTLLKVSNGEEVSDINKLSKTKNIFYKFHFDPMGAVTLSESLLFAKEFGFNVDKISLAEELVDFIHEVNANIGDRKFINSQVVEYLEAEIYKNCSSIIKKIEGYLEQFVVKKKWTILTEKNRKIDHAKIFKNVKKMKETINTIKYLDEKKIRDKEGWVIYFNTFNAERYIDYLKVRLETNLRGSSEDFEKELRNQLGAYFQGNNVSKQYYSFLVDFYNYYPSYALEDHQESEEGCFVVTVTTGSSENIIVNDFREYRNNVLIHTNFGRHFIDTYYKVGPYIADFISEKPLLKIIILKGFIEPLHKVIKQ